MIDPNTGKYRKRIPYGMMNFEAVREGVCTTKLHKIITVWYGTEMVVCEDVE